MVYKDIVTLELLLQGGMWVKASVSNLMPQNPKPQTLKALNPKPCNKAIGLKFEPSTVFLNPKNANPYNPKRSSPTLP